MTQQATSTNPLFAHGTPPRFEEITPAHAKEAVPELLERASVEFSAFEEAVEPTGMASSGAYARSSSPWSLPGT